MALYRLTEPEGLVDPVVVTAFDGWVDAGSAATAATKVLAEDSQIVVEFDGDQLFDYRARRPTLEIQDGRPERLTWPTLQLRRRRIGERDILVLSGAEPDFKWRRFSADVVEIAKKLKVAQWISLGAIPAAVPHTRSVPIMGTESKPGLLRGNVLPGPQGILHVPAAAISILEMTLASSGTPTLGYFAQVPHYVSGPYPAAALALLRTLERHLGVVIPVGDLADEGQSVVGLHHLPRPAPLDSCRRNETLQRLRERRIPVLRIRDRSRLVIQAAEDRVATARVLVNAEVEVRLRGVRVQAGSGRRVTDARANHIR